MQGRDPGPGTLEQADRTMFWRTAPWCVVLIHAVCGLYVALAWFPIGDLAVESDFFTELGPGAQAIARGEISVHNHPYKGPLYGVVLAIVHGLLQPMGIGWYRAALVLSLLSTAGALFLVFRLVRDLAGPRAGLGAMVLTSAVCEVFVQSHKASSDPLFLLLCLAVVTAAFSPERIDSKRWLLAGGLAGAAFLTRYIGAVLLVWLAWQAITAGGAARAATWRRICLAAAGWLILAGPWLLLSLQQTGSLLETRNLETVVRTFAPVIGDDAAGSIASVSHIIAHDPPRVLGFYLLRTLDTLRMDALYLMGVPAACAALLGFLVLAARLGDRRAWRWLAAGGLYLLALGWVFYLPRFALPQVPLYAMLVCIGIFTGPRPEAPRWDRRLAAFWAWRRFLPAWLVLLALVGFHVTQCGRAVAFYRAEQPTHLRAVIDHLEGVAAMQPEGGRLVLMARTAHAAFHAGCDHRPYPRRELTAEQFLDFARDQGAGLVLVGPVERRLAAHHLFLDDLAGYGGVKRSFDDGLNAVLVLEPADSGFGRDLVAESLAGGMSDSVRDSDLKRALDLSSELIRRHLRARRFDAARSVVVDLLSHLEDQPDGDQQLIGRLRQDLERFDAIMADVLAREPRGRTP